MKRAITVVALACAVAFGFSAAVYAQAKAPGVVVLKGNPMGGVKFDHVAHQKRAASKCDTCHHASKPEKPLKAAQENCQDCHVKTPVAPMKTSVKLAFHDAMAKKGTCIDCHVTQNAAGKKAPTKCTECHVKANG